ncbi:MAG: RNA-directed DNA polymerase [Patescibacteria group bacterium]
MHRQPTGLPIGNLTSQLFANIYLDAFDHFIKEELRIKYYLRYTDDVVILSDNRQYLLKIVSEIERWLWRHRRLTLHPNKTSVRKLCQGIDFLGYVILPHHHILRTKTKRRMLKRFNQENSASYLGLLKHCAGYDISVQIRKNLSDGTGFFRI